MTTERRRTTELVGGGPGPAGPLDLDGGAPAGTATIAHGPYAEALPVAGMTVGQVRERFADRLDIHPEATALIDGEPADDEVRVRADSLVMFVQRAGEKGAGKKQLSLGLFEMTPQAPPTPGSKTGSATGLTTGSTSGDAPKIEIIGDEVRVTTPEGAAATRKLDDVLEELASPWPGLESAVLTDGVKLVRPAGDRLIVVHQTPPRVWRFRWIASDSPARHGPGTTYREVRLALPYLVLLARFERMGGGIAGLGRWNEAFFSTVPVDSGGLDTPLAFPALLNCSKLPDEEGRPLSWICTQHMRPPDGLDAVDLGGSVRAWLRVLLHHLLETGFNYSSEEHEGASWFSVTLERKVDPRITDVESWEAASRADPLFALDVDWLSTGRTLGDVIARAVAAGDMDGPGRPRTQTQPRDAAMIARLVMNKPVVRRRRRRGAAQKKESV